MNVGAEPISLGTVVRHACTRKSRWASKKTSFPVRSGTELQPKSSCVHFWVTKTLLLA